MPPLPSSPRLSAQSFPIRISFLGFRSSFYSPFNRPLESCSPLFSSLPFTPSLPSPWASAFDEVPPSSSARIPFPHHDLPSLAAPQSVMKGWPCSEHTVTCDNECESEEEGQDRRRRRGVQRVGAARRSHRLQGSNRPLQGKFDEVLM